ncbi:fused MFS/spermidine synthase [candidate division KSB1 bacterium]|nr:fused MFS/spermidine synthase [candidate division KSB1 bacterium]
MMTKSGLKSSLILYGFTTIIAQVILMRELLTIFYGNELSMGILLAVWLGWTALGSGVLGKRIARLAPGFSWFAGCLLLLAFTLPLTIYVNRLSLFWFNYTPGEITGVLPILLVPLFSLSLFCCLIGILFTLGCYFYSQIESHRRTHVVSQVYILEAIGAGIGGFLTSFCLVQYFTTLEIAAILSVINFAAGGLLWSRPRFKSQLTFRLLNLSLIGISGWGFWLGQEWLEVSSQKMRWREYDTTHTINSRYGILTVSEFRGSYSFFENNLLMYTVPDLFYAEESVHFALLAHPEPRQVLLIGGGPSGSLKEILKHPSVQSVDYVELDPLNLELAMARLPRSETEVFQDPRIHLHFMDGRRFLRRSDQKYDVIITNLPEPVTTQLNRFYSAEFFQIVRSRLTEVGIFGFRVTSAENYISENLSRFLSCLYNTLSRSLPSVILIPGDTNHFLASPAPEILQLGPQVLLTRLQARNIETQFLNAYYLPYRMSHERMVYLSSRINTTTQITLNHDFQPHAYFLNLILWSRHSSAILSEFLQFIATHRVLFIGGVLFCLSIGLWLGFCRQRHPEARLSKLILVAVMFIGFTQIGLEFSLLLAFQALYGYAYHQIALIVTGFMLGLTLGGWQAVRGMVARPQFFSRFMRIQFGVTLFPLILLLILAGLAQLKSTDFTDQLMEFGFMFLVFGVGWLGGSHFALASALTTPFSRTPTEAGGRVYAWDLFGSCLGAGLTSSFFIPLIGIEMTFLMYALLNGVIFCALILVSRTSATA